jgi:hypothetical protein
LRPLIQCVRVDQGISYAAATAHMLLNWPFWYALTARDMQSSSLTIESGCFDAILVENLV